jgi:hypothetical protein
MLQVTVSNFRRFWVGRRVCDSPKAARWLAAADGRFREKPTWSDRRKLVARDPSGESATNSAAYLPAGQRVSMRTLRPSIQPNCWSIHIITGDGLRKFYGICKPTKRLF